MDVTLFLENSALAFAVTAAVLGLIVGSFLNVVIHRLPIMLEKQWQIESGTAPPASEKYNLVIPRSRCPHCGHAITAVENIPVLSYLALHGRCRGCGQRISPRYLAVEILCGLLSGWVAWHFGFSWQTCAGLLLTWGLLVLAGIDLEKQLLPDAITLPLLWLGLLLNAGNVFTDLRSAVIGAAAGYLSLWCVFHLFRLLTGKEGMGYGDFKLLALIGAWLGWREVPTVIFMAAGVGSLVGISLLLSRRLRPETPIPFGPYLTAAGWIALLWGRPLTDAYLGISGMR